MEPSAWIDELRTLSDKACNGALTEPEAEQLEEILDCNTAAQQFYLDRISLDAWLRWKYAGEAHQEPAPPTPLPAPCPSQYSYLAGPLTYVMSGWPAAYLIATVICGIAAVIGAVTHISQPGQIAVEQRPAIHDRTELRPTTIHRVAQITGSIDCRWVDAKNAPTTRNIGLGDTLDLAAGAIEIEYDSGANVVLQGPATYEVSSDNGGFLSLGKLTARVEKPSKTRAERVDRAAERPLFTVTTPTAVVTDLGTEFGVEVSRDGNTWTHVFRGVVRVETTAGVGDSDRQNRVLRENESVAVNRDARRVVIVDSSAKPPVFIRELPSQTIKVLDLVDVVAGGNGFSKKRGRGIDAVTGEITDLPRGPSAEMDGDHQYHTLDSLPFVDGVFVPDGSDGPVQIDSAGHVFPDCPKTDNRTWINLWAGGRLPEELSSRMAADLGGVDYFSPEHAVLLVHANKGLTFDLDAIRRANPGCKLLRFRSVVGNMEPDSAKSLNVSAEVWVLIDGQVRFKRREMNHFTGAQPIDLPIGPDDRFLTLAATDGGNTFACDLIIFGDPRLEILSAASRTSE